jgi:drug/metabolite transporter (DMT)-like permease
MIAFSLPEVTTITSEVVLSLYPILIKVIDTGLDSQILGRLATFATLSIITLNGFNIVNILANPFLLLFLGLINLVHIGSSYQAFKDLPAGPAMALFYTYPFLNILLAWFILNEPINLKHLPWLFIAFLGSILVIKSLKQEESFEEKAQATNANTNTVRGIFAAFSAALTESIIYVVTKNLDAASPFPMMAQLYGGALILFIGGLVSQGKPILTDTRKTTWIPLLAFNILIGFIGYALRFWSIPRLSATVFSILSFVGVFSAYIFGVRFVGEIPSLESLAGGTLIAASIAGVRGNFGF